MITLRKIPLSAEDTFILSSRMYALRGRAEKEYRKHSWGFPVGYKYPKGAVNHPSTFRMYDRYNVVWLIPGTKNVIDKFELDEDSLDPRNSRSMFMSDMSLLRSDRVTMRRIEITLENLRNGRFVFEDDDDTQDNMYKSSNPVFGNWDTATHYLAEFQKLNMDELPYSKCLNDRDRLNYAVGRPKMNENGEFVSRIRLSRCFDHNYDNIPYSKGSLNRSFEVAKELLYSDSLPKLDSLNDMIW